MPKVSVVMACCNSDAEKLRQSINSVLNQTWRDLELIIVDDGSKEAIQTEVSRITSDNRVRVFRIEHSGLGAALNHGVGRSLGDYIARLDDDDLALPSRIEKQVAFLDAHPNVSCVGTWFYDMVGDKFLPHRAYPTEHEQIIQGLLSLHWGLAHTAVMFRKSTFDKIGGYRIPGGGQDLDLFLQLGTVGKLANIGEYLTCYRMSVSGLGTVNPKKNEAYLFALEDVLNRNLYPRYNETIKGSVTKLKESMNSKPKTRYYRMLLVWRVKLLGKKMIML